MSQEVFRKSLRIHMINAEPPSGTITPITRRRGERLVRFIGLVVTTMILIMLLFSVSSLGVHLRSQ